MLLSKKGSGLSVKSLNNCYFTKIYSVYKVCYKVKLLRGITGYFIKLFSTAT